MEEEEDDEEDEEDALRTMMMTLMRKGRMQQISLIVSRPEVPVEKRQLPFFRAGFSSAPFALFYRKCGLP
jgi:hypothetical protein